MKTEQPRDKFLDALGQDNFLTNFVSEIIIVVFPVVFSVLSILITFTSIPIWICFLAIALFLIWSVFTVLSFRAKRYFTNLDRSELERLKVENEKIDSLELKLKQLKTSRLGFCCLAEELIREIERCRTAQESFQLRKFYNQVATEIFNCLNGNFSVAIYEVTKQYVTMVSQRMFSSLDEPRIYEQHFSKTEAKKFLFGKIACSKDSRIVLLENNEKIVSRFYIPNETSSTKLRYSQYIGLPIYRKKGRNFAVIEIVAYDNSRIMEGTMESLNEFAEDQIVPIAHLLKIAKGVINA